ncbi:ABC transporter ATP-binding protein [Pseudacidobacterium ailaaui]|jgi:phospholipid/cholesterol/gamma-HCH transport system ATP-binding protein|uniref:ABC transporter ATP-binding protein n=1 Tax=Pseudacidobacterium ailaaui TaxID=1382359 RepID=UPI0005D245BB|nr:ATP-binding cassette domain-containing protein [Pseudacidobacterium ailaaui]MBX6358905.1 ATP-binding cassette domain-containing protein [Pseudacidobacterium ailaaui]MCL6464541.1 ATP-binding cassette domain-containing protein [Pseudacidobacterium ailaaui]MDI3255062.1 ATP-binding cassette domain-containing protein [Bacillota bacterium]
MSQAAVAPELKEHPQDEPTIVFEHVSIGFEGKPVLQDISFTVKRGETRILLGPAGVGKSVLLKLADGLLRPDEGRIYVFGQEISAMREKDLYSLRRRIGIVFQESALFDSLTVRDNVAYRLMEEHVPPEEIEQRVTEALRFVELEHTLDKFPAELSGGMRRRVAIARAIVTRPDLLLYDSPTGGLDPITSTTIIELVVKQRDVYRTSSLLVTHRLQDAFLLASHRFDREANRMEPLPEGHSDPQTSFLVLNEGRLVFDGSTHDLVHSDDPFLKQYLS